MLRLNGGDEFASIAMDFDNRPIREGDDSTRIIIRVNVQTIPALAVVDTGGVFLVIPPYISDNLSLDAQDMIDDKPKPIKIGGHDFRGKLFSVPLSFGNSDSSKLVTAFVVDPELKDNWGDFPLFLGFQGCLDKFRFAVDPFIDKFYIGDIT
ncbi:MAG: hypothetical protein NTZ74_02875 [Chloroflexi bacterium]|nr:hypothetical protein [Chloroflexota bacterium]